MKLPKEILVYFKAFPDCEIINEGRVFDSIISMMRRVFEAENEIDAVCAIEWWDCWHGDEDLMLRCVKKIRKLMAKN